MQTSTALNTFDAQKAEAFAGRLVTGISEAAAILMTSLGHRAGLFDELARYSPATSTMLAERAGCAERYVREWLAVMVTAGVVDYDPNGETYRLPPEHAASLTRSASPNNLAVTSQFITVAAAVEDDILARFYDGDGLHYHHYRRFHEVMAEDSAQLVVDALLEHIVPIVDGLQAQLERGIDAVDIGCGGGRALLRLAAAFPKSDFLGLDLCAEAFAPALLEAQRLGLDNLRFEARDLSGLTSVGQFDLVTAFDAVHDQKHPQDLLQMVRNSLTPEGVFLMQDIGGSRQLENNLDNPFGPLLYTLSLMHCTPISLGQGGDGLGTMWGVETAREYLATAGFNSVQTHRLAHDPINAYFVARC